MESNNKSAAIKELAEKIYHIDLDKGGMTSYEELAEKAYNFFEQRIKNLIEWAEGNGHIAIKLAREIGELQAENARLREQIDNAYRKGWIGARNIQFNITMEQGLKLFKENPELTAVEKILIEKETLT